MEDRTDPDHGPLARLLSPRATGSGGDRYDFPVSAEPWPRIYGGQLLGQACAAAGVTVPDRCNLHSLHTYFLRSGDPSRPVCARVARERDGRQFVVRSVILSQDGDDLAKITASYHAAEPGWAMMRAPPPAADPDALDSDRARVFDRIGDLPRDIALPRNVLRDLDYRLAAVDEAADTRALWVRTISTLPDTRRMREAAVAYLSDFTLVGAALLGRRAEPDWRGIRGGSLDHALWLHGDPRPADWLLYAQQGMWAGGARGLALGQLYDRVGGSVATTMQEALVRPC